MGSAPTAIEPVMHAQLSRPNRTPLFLRSAALAATALAATLPHASAAPTQDPFAQGERWSHAPAASDWMPDQVLFAGDDSFVWTAQRGADHALRLLDAVADGSQAARGTVAQTSDEFGSPIIATGSRGDAVFALRQFNQPSAFARTPLVMAYDPTAASGGAEMAASWSHDLDVRINGPVRLACDRTGSIVAAAAWNSTTGSVRVDVIDGTDGTLLGRRDMPAFSLNGLAVSGDGTRIAVASGLTLYVLDALATPIHSEPLTTATQALALSFDGTTLAFGEIGAVNIFRERSSGGYTTFQRYPAATSELPSRLDLSDDGSLMAIAWWNYTSGTDARFEIYDSVFQFPLASHTQFALPGALQNLPIEAKITADGNRAAFATWGNGSDPEVIMLNIGGFGPSLQVDLSGSSRGMDFDASGTRLAIGHKDVHSSVFGATGAVRLVDTGERSLAVTNTPLLGGTLEVAAIEPGSFGGWFMLGPKAATPIVFPGVTGLLRLQRNQLTVFGRLSDADGRINLSLPIPNTAAMVGQQMHVQAAFRTTQGLKLTENLVSPFVVR